MDSRQKYEHWEDIAIYDFETAKAMLSTGRYLYVVFMCQQAIEKLVKGVHLLYTGEEAPRTHNIWLVINRLVESEEFKKVIEENIYSKKLTLYKSFFADLMFYYISERYPSYKEKLSTSVTEAKAKEVIAKAEEVFKWVQSLSQFKK